MGIDEWANCPSSCRLAASAQCRSSSTTSSGVSSDAAARNRTTASMTMKRSASDSAAGVGVLSQATGEVGNEAGEGEAIALGESAEHLVPETLHEGGEGLHPRLVGDGQVLVAAAVEDGGAAVVHRSRRLSHERRLAHPRLTGDEDDTEVVLSGASLVEVFERLQLVGPAEEREEALGRGGDEPGGKGSWVPSTTASASGAQRTSTTSIGSGKPFRSTSPNATNS